MALILLNSKSVLPILLIVILIYFYRPISFKRYKIESTMKLLLVLSILATLTAAVLSKEIEYLRGHDFDAYFANDAQRQAIFDCLLNNAPCGNLQAFKDSIITVIQNNCAKCTPKQKEKYERLTKVFKDKYGAVYNELVMKIERESK